MPESVFTNCVESGGLVSLDLFFNSLVVASCWLLEGGMELLMGFPNTSTHKHLLFSKPHSCYVAVTLYLVTSGTAKLKIIYIVID